MKLRDWVPPEFFVEYTGTRAYKMLDVEVVRNIGVGGECDITEARWPGPQQNVFNWCVLANDYAVGWNENPGHGWSFPVVKMKVNA